VDHGYAVYAAASRVVSAIHQDPTVGIAPIRGRYAGGGLLHISPHTRLVLRIPASRIPVFLPLAGKVLEIDGYAIRLGVPETRSLVPAAALYAHMVTTRNGHDPVRFEAEVARQLVQLGVGGRLSVGRRRTFDVHGKQVVGYSVLVSELTAEESIALQENGLGGRRKMGCGFFGALRP